MRRYIFLIISLMLAVAGGTAVAQEEAETEEATAAEGAEAAPAVIEEDEATEADEDDNEDEIDDEIDDSDLDLQTYEEDEDDFVPTEEIPADEAIPFPTDI